MIDIWRFSAFFFSTPSIAGQLSEKISPQLPSSQDGGSFIDKTKFPNQGNNQIVLQIHIKEEYEAKNQDHRAKSA
jgi:hypothetical protein